MSVSVVIIAKDEEKMLPGCLATLDWADEVLVIDTGSIDQTVQVSRKSGARVIEYTSGKNFSDWRNKGLATAKGEWLLYVDADERVPSALKQEISKTIKEENQTSAFAIPRKNFVFGKWLKHGGFWPDYQKRFFRKNKLQKWQGEVHEEPVFKGSLGHLASPLTHLKHETFSEMLDKTDSWSAIEARLMFESNHPPMNVLRFTSAMFREFWHRMIMRRAFLDGKVGVVFAIYQVFSRFISYAKLWELQIKR